MQYEVKNLITDLTCWAGLSGPIPSAAELRRKREQARRIRLLDNVQSRDRQQSSEATS